MFDGSLSACPICAAGKGSNRPPAGLLQPLSVPSQPWSHIAMDFVTGLPPSNGKTVVLTVVDRFSKATHFIPLPKLPSARETATIVLDHVQGWTGNRAYRAFSRWADALKGPTEFFFFFCQGPSRRDNEQSVAHWFVSCIDSVNHPITMRYRQSDEVFCSA